MYVYGLDLPSVIGAGWCRPGRADSSAIHCHSSLTVICQSIFEPAHQDDATVRSGHGAADHFSQQQFPWANSNGADDRFAQHISLILSLALRSSPTSMNINKSYCFLWARTSVASIASSPSPGTGSFILYLSENSQLSISQQLASQPGSNSIRCSVAVEVCLVCGDRSFVSVSAALVRGSYPAPLVGSCGHELALPYIVRGSNATGCSPASGMEPG
jgi:hypothetical protein